MDKRNKDINEYLVEEATNTTEIGGSTLFKIVYTFLSLHPILLFILTFVSDISFDISIHVEVEIT